MDARNNIATDLFYKVRSRFSGLKLGAETGEITINPEEARFFDFDYMEGQTPIGHVSISLAEPNSMKVYFSHGISESMDDGQKKNWYGFLKELRMFAKRRLLNFDTRDIAKDNLDKRDYAFLSQYAKPSSNSSESITKPVGESIMSESSLYGTKTMSYQKLMDTRLIIKHSQAVMDDTQPGARSRHIAGLFVENQDGERFKYPFIHLAGARAMQRHVANGGVPYDDIGKSIVQMSEEIAQLKSFSAYVVRNDLMNSDTNGIVERSSGALNSLREQMKALAKQGHYEAYKENFQAHQPLEIPQDVVEDYTEKFTVRNFKEDIASAFPIIYRLMQESDIGYDDIVAMTTQQEITTEEEDLQANDPFAQFESWVMNLGEDSAIQSTDPEEQQAAIQGLQELVAQAFPAGVDGSNAIASLKGLIEDNTLYQEIKQSSVQDPEMDVRGIVQGWLNLYAPEVMEQLDFGDYADTTGENPAAPQAAPAVTPEVPAAESLEEAAASGDYEIEVENVVVEFDRNAYGDPVVTKVMMGNTDITAIEDLEAIADSIDERDTSPLENVYTELSIDLETDYTPAERGSREGGMQMEPDYDAEVDVTGIIAYGNGKKISISIDDFPEDAQEKINSMAYEAATTSDDDDFDIPDDYYEAINPKNPRDYERPAVDRKKDGQPPLRMQDVKAKDTEHKRNYDARVHGADRPQKESQKKSGVNVQEVAEFIHSFYDKESGTFPKGPEGVATMVGKKFGERAEHAARQMVERMAPQQADPQIAELARIKELSGLR